MPAEDGLSPLYTWRYGYNEGSAWQFMFYMQYDVPGLAAMFARANPGLTPKQALERQLDLFFTSTSESSEGGYGFPPIHEAEELEHIGLGQYGFNDQPSWGYVYEYNYTDVPWKTQCIVRNILDPNRPETHQDYLCFDGKSGGTSGSLPVYVLFGDQVQGLLGDEDTGSMSAWLVNSAMGLHPVSGTEQILFGSPLFNEIRIRVPAYDGHKRRKLTIKAPKNNRDNIYVSRIKLNGKPLDLPANNYGITHSELFERRNSTLVFEMSDSPGGD